MSVENPFADRTEDEVLATVCNFPRYRHEGKTWADVIRIDPSYVIWLGEQGKLSADEAFLAELAYENEEDEEDDGLQEDRHRYHEDYRD